MAGQQSFWKGTAIMSNTIKNNEIDLSPSTQARTHSKTHQLIGVMPFDLSKVKRQMDSFILEAE